MLKETILIGGKEHLEAPKTKLAKNQPLLRSHRCFNQRWRWMVPWVWVTQCYLPKRGMLHRNQQTIASRFSRRTVPMSMFYSRATRAFSESMSTSAREQMCHEFGVEKKVDVNKHPLGIPCGLASSMAVFPGRPTVWGVLFWRFEDAIKVAVESISKVLNVVSQKAFLD